MLDKLPDNIENIIKHGSNAFFINELGEEFPIDKFASFFYITKAKNTVKVEGLEEYYTEYLPKTVHMYISPANAKSFGLHKDPYDVIIKCILGKKTMVIDNKLHTIHEGEEMIIPANIEHNATNEFDSIILSIGDNS